MHCNNTGYVPAPIYGGDVVYGVTLIEEPDQAAGEYHDVGIVSMEDGGQWIVKDIDHRDDKPAVVVSGWNNDEPPILLGNIFEADKLTKPDGVSDKDWGWVMGVHKEMMLALRSPEGEVAEGE